MWKNTTSPDGLDVWQLDLPGGYSLLVCGQKGTAFLDEAVIARVEGLPVEELKRELLGQIVGHLTRVLAAAKAAQY